MFKKAVLMVFATMLLITGAGIASANQIGGMASNNGPALPTGLTVSVNPGGLGDGLIYGYYNTRDALTFFRLVNTSTTDAVKARVRFREAKTSAEILDFNVCLSNKDQWSAWIMTNPNGTGAGIYPVDAGLFRGSLVGDTITRPNIPQLAISSSGAMSGGQAFKCGKGTGCSVSGVASLANVTADDTREGYWEVIATTAKTGGTETTKINFDTTPTDECLNPVSSTNFVDVPNVLGGDASVIVLRTGVSGMFQYNATAIADCNVNADYAVANESPTWGACADGVNGVDYVLTKQDHIAMYNVEDWDKAQTEVIVNFPTKSLHTILPVPTSGSYWTKPFDTVDSYTNQCEPINLNLYNDLQDTTTSTTDFSPSSGPTGATFCNEVNVIKIESSDILESSVSKTLKVSSVTPFTGLGWIRIGLNTGAPTCTSGNSVCAGGKQSFGLPSLGYVLTDLVDSLGSLTETKYDTNIQ